MLHMLCAKSVAPMQDLACSGFHGAKAIVEHAVHETRLLLAVREHAEMPPNCATARGSDSALAVR